MLIRIETSRRLGLRVIEEIPDIPLCKIEGYNGIGKTSAIRLLALCTGGQPFAGNAAAWQTFRGQLGATRVSVNGLKHGAGSIEWNLTPDQWIGASEEPLGAEIGTVRIDGKLANFSDVLSLLRVHHINAADTPEKILAERTRSASNIVDGWYRKHGASRIHGLDELIQPVVRILTECPTTEDVMADLRAATRARNAATTADTLASSARERGKLLKHAVEVAEMIDAIRGASPTAETKLRELQDRLHEIDEIILNLDQQVADAHKRQNANQQAEREFSLAQKFHVSASESLRKATNELSKAAAAVDVPPDSGQVSKARAASERKLNALIETQPYVNTAPLTIAVLNDLAARLDDAVAAGLGAEFLIDQIQGSDIETSQRGWTTAGLRDIFREKAVTLAHRKPGPDAEQLSADIDAVRTRLDALAEIVLLLENVDQAEKKLARAELRLVEATRALPDSAAETLNHLVHERTKYDQEGRTVQSRIDRLRAELDRLGGGKSEEELARELGQLCEDAGVDTTQVWSALEQSREELAELERNAAQLMSHATTAERAARDRRGAVNRTVTELAVAEALEWLRFCVPAVANIQDMETAEQMSIIETLRRTLTAVRQKLDHLTGNIQGIGAAFHVLAERLEAKGGADTGTKAWAAPAGQWLTVQVQQWFDDDLMREALFGGGRDLSLDANDLTLSWTLDGNRLSRPLSGFSSGEQVVAHTRARLAQLERDDSAVANQLIALDEFGAFLDEQRLASLADYLGERALRVPNDQVVVILPCGSVRFGEASGSTGTSGHAAELAERGYFAEAFRL